MVATPHSGACSLSIDLRSDEISATGGHRLFAQSFFETLTAVAWEAYTASSIVVTSHWEDHSFQMTSALTRFLPPAVIRASPVLKHGCLLNNSELLLLKLVVYHKRKGSTKGCHSERNGVNIVVVRCHSERTSTCHSERSRGISRKFVTLRHASP